MTKRSRWLVEDIIDITPDLDSTDPPFELRIELKGSSTKFLQYMVSKTSIDYSLCCNHLHNESTAPLVGSVGVKLLRWDLGQCIQAFLPGNRASINNTARPPP